MIIEWQSGKYLQPNTYIDGGDGYVIGYSGVIAPQVVSAAVGIIKLAGEHRALGFGSGGTVGLKRSREGDVLGFGVEVPVGLKRLL